MIIASLLQRSIIVLMRVFIVLLYSDSYFLQKEVEVYCTRKNENVIDNICIINIVDKSNFGSNMKENTNVKSSYTRGFGNSVHGR